jgi:hypothetical protein
MGLGLGLHSDNSSVQDEIALVLNPARVEIFVLRQDKVCMEKRELSQKLLLKTIQICVVATQKFPTQTRFQHKSDFEHKNYKSVGIYT